MNPGSSTARGTAEARNTKRRRRKEILEESRAFLIALYESERSRARRNFYVLSAGAQRFFSASVRYLRRRTRRDVIAAQ